MKKSIPFDWVIPMAIYTFFGIIIAIPVTIFGSIAAIVIGAVGKILWVALKFGWSFF